MAFNVMIELKDTSLHNIDNSASDEEPLYNDEEMSYEELKRSTP